MWISLLALLLYRASCNTLIQYRLGVNYGQVFKDYSENGWDAVNGDKSYNQNNDTSPTDRGAFFSDSFEDIIIMPQNDVVGSKFSLPNTYMLNAWVLFQEDGFIIAINFDSYNYLRIKKVNDYLQIATRENSVTNFYNSTVSVITTSKI
jgi:hypothetical protein